ncbi:hypothetical protein NMK71_06235 [Weeksellaceae bacterium KMM 9713]|uniref:Uncharacterized protein n=1 Tax=Profundicola chukchiensis TaxID=2961959 RepID=A0A9X4RUT3_9FLAO|nr:hypothetical protein [Profundicola chukchiensis]MDG4946006.1 hypothetical protein [Profundicola chukchiensis]
MNPLVSLSVFVKQKCIENLDKRSTKDVMLLFCRYFDTIFSKEKIIQCDRKHKATCQAEGFCLAKLYRSLGQENK